MLEAYDRPPYPDRHAGLEPGLANPNARDPSTVAGTEVAKQEPRFARDDFAVRTAESSEEVPGCVKTFAYWDPGFLAESELLNSQTGELMDVSIEELEQQNFSVRGESRLANRYRVLARDVDLVLWYDDENRWLGLQSTTKDGHRIRYELI